MAYTPTLYERETIIRWDDESNEATFYTASPIWMRRMDKIVQQHPESFSVKSEFYVQGEISGKTYSMPKDFVSIRTKQRVSTMTAEQKAEAAERLRALNEAKKLILES